MLRLEKTATPATAVAVVVPESVAPLVPVPAVIVSVTLPVKPVAVWPAASRAVTCTAGLMVAPAAVPVGGTVKTSWFGRTVVISKGALAASVRRAAVAESV